MKMGKDHGDPETEDHIHLCDPESIGDTLKHGILPRQQTSPGEMITFDVSWRADERGNQTFEILFYAERAKPTERKVFNEFLTTPSCKRNGCSWWSVFILFPPFHLFHCVYSNTYYTREVVKCGDVNSRKAWTDMFVSFIATCAFIDSSDVNAQVYPS